MPDQQGKFIRLFGTIFFSLIGAIVSFVLLMLLFRWLISSLDYIPWFTYFYMSLILLLPTALFVSVFAIFFRRTKMHPSKPVRIFSSAIFLIGILSWFVVLGFDCINFFKTASPEISQYYSYNLLYLVGNVGIIFFIGIIQALTTAKEKDWMERRG